MKLQSYVVIAVLSLFILSCGSKRNVVSSKKTVATKKLPSVNQNEHVKKLKKNSPNLNKYTLTYIKKYAPLAVIKMHEYKIPASITLAQGVLESGNGRSILASKSNNHFGIKCHSGWTGQKVYHDDDKKDDCFRKYDYVEQSYNDHSEFLTGRKRYAFLFKYRTTDYKRWAKGLKKAGYATDKKYPNKLIKIIQNYKLHEFDKVKKRDLKKSKKSSVKKPITSKSKKSNDALYTVKKGDTLYSIARKHKITVEKIKKDNDLVDTVLSIGQQLKIKL